NPVLLVDDEPHTLQSYAMALRMNGIDHLVTCEDSKMVINQIQNRSFELCLLDLIMPDVSGEELLKHIRHHFPEIPVIVVTGVNEVETAVHCMKEGAFDYFLKPVEMDRLISGVKRAIQHRELMNENRLLKEKMLSAKLSTPTAFSGIITRNQAMFSIFQYAEAIGPSRQPILITGETGVGKELMVQAIHRLSPESGPLLSVNVAGIDDHAFSDTLFGHIKGAFTGADRRRPGLLEQASGGALHLDEIGDLNPESQVKLLRLLEEREYFPLGTDTPKSSDARIIVSTNLDLDHLQGSGKFRRDLFYRLCTHHIHIPPLRERAGDIPLLLDYFLEEAGRTFGKKSLSWNREIIELLSRHSFPGNIRELKSIIFDAVSRCTTDQLTVGLFNSLDVQGGRQAAKTPSPSSADHSTWLKNFPRSDLPTLEEATEQLIQEAMDRFDNNKSMAARVLGISRQRLARCLKKKDSGAS
ncbi:MAG: sigma-54-dependent transcriptional regulator, partial [Thermodesulfobacteriota bacterium]